MLSEILLSLNTFFTYLLSNYNKIYTIDGKLAVDYVGKFETLKKDIIKIQKKLKLPKERFKLFHTKKNTSKNHLKFYTKESKELVKEIWSILEVPP